MHLADPNPVLFVIAAVVGIVTAVLAVLYVREVTANGKAAEADTSNTTICLPGNRASEAHEKGVVR